MPDLDAHYEASSEARRLRRWDRLNEIHQRAQRDLSKNQKPDREWFVSALADSDKKYFVAWVLKRASIPRLLLPHLLRAAVEERNLSMNQDFLLPCVATYGRDKVKALLMKIAAEGTESDKEGVERVSHWLNSDATSSGGDADGKLSTLWAALRSKGERRKLILLE